MDGYVSKPIAAEEMLTAIHAVIPKERQNAIAALAVQRPETPAAAPPADGGSPPVNFQTLRRRCMGNTKLAARALETFGATIDSYVQDLSASLQSGDAKSAGATAHKIKGAAGNVSADEISRIAGDLEKLSKSDQIAQSQAALSQLQREVARAREFIATSMKELIDA
jgi:HPt (histidine-containing phosphotransfer) domain-containing protein